MQDRMLGVIGLVISILGIPILVAIICRSTNKGSPSQRLLPGKSYMLDWIMGIILGLVIVTVIAMAVEMLE